MKKRLLSAALALAMVLTLLPLSAVPAFAVTPATQRDPDTVFKTYDANGNGVDHFYKEVGDNITSVTVQRCAIQGDDGREYGKWYWEDNVNKVDNKSVFYEVTSGIIAGNNGSGTWYKDANDFIATTNGKKSLRSTSFTLLGNTRLAVGDASNDDWTSTSISINADIEGSATLTLHPQVTNATVTSLYQIGNQGTVTVTGRNHSGYAASGIKTNGLILTATNVKVTMNELKGRQNTITLNNCTTTGTVTLDGQYASDQKVPPTYGYSNQSLTVNGGSVTGAVTIKNTTPAVSLTNCSGVTGVTYTNTNAGSFAVAGTTNVSGPFKVTPRTKDSTYPTVNIDGGWVQAITQQITAGDGNVNGNSITVGINNSGASVGAVTIEKGTLNVAGGKLTQASAVKEGTLNVSGNGVKFNNKITLGANGDVNLTISATNSTFSGIEVPAGKGGNLKSVTWPAGRGNSYGTLDLDTYAGHGVKGGKFAVACGAADKFGALASLGWFDTSLQYMAPISAAEIALYGRDELAKAIAETTQPKGVAYGKTAISMLGQGDGTTAALTLKNGQDVWAKIYYNSPSKFILPTQINTVKVGSWIVDQEKDTAGDGNKRSFVAGTEETIGWYTDGLTLNANPNGTSAFAEKLTNATNKGVVDLISVVQNKDVTVTLNNNKINLTGAVTNTAGGIATIEVELTTDVLKTSGTGYETLTVKVFYDVDKKTFSFEKTSALGFGAIIDANGDLVLNNGVGAHYTVGGNLAVSEGSLGIVGPARANDTVVGAVGGNLSSRNQAQKDAIIKGIQDGASFSYANSPAFRQAVNAAQASITSKSTVDGWINTARTTVWRNGYKKTPTSSYESGMVPHSTNYANVAAADKTEVTNAFAKAYIVPYLQITATNLTQTGELTLTVQPYYRVDVSAADGYVKDVYYTVQTGRAMTLSGSMGSGADGVELTLPLSGSAFGAVVKTYMHQDGKYVYTVAGTKYTITHIGANGSLGTMVLNGTDGSVQLEPTAENEVLRDYKCKYDNLQAAIDDTGVETRHSNGKIKKKDLVRVLGNYTGSCDVTMTGLARTIDVKLEGLQTLKWSGAEVASTKDDATGLYTLQLKKDTAPKGGNITIASATGGSASVSANPATVGSTVTITLNPASGYIANGVTVRTSGGQNVSVSGSGNTYTFTMPSGTVTVTPSFTQRQVVNPTVSVSNPSTGGTAVTSAGTSQVAPGTTVTVTTSPSAGQRTMGLNVTGATATRTGANTFTFTVPSGYTNVVVTPRFDRNNGTMFDDVWSYDYFSDAVAWASTRGITNGDGSIYHFGTGKSCTREDMVTFLWRNAGSPVVTGVSNPFWDVQPGAYYYNAVMWAVRNGITNGVTTTQFGVGQSVTRAQAVTFLYRAAGSPAASTNSGFYDVPSREYYAKAVSWAVAKGITNGDGSAVKFSPNNPCLREQIVAFMYRDSNNIRA